MEPELKLHTKEIPAKGKGYFIIEKCWPDQLDGAVRRGARALLAQGATAIYVCSKDPAANLCAGRGEGYRLEFRHDMLNMERRLDADRPRPAARLTLEPLQREKGGAWLALYNESFFDVPNSETCGRDALEEFLGDHWRCGFALLDGVPVGVYQLGLQGASPEIAAIGLTKDVRRRGLGRELLLCVMDLCAALGHESAWLRVSTANESAYGLYRSTGFRVTELLSHWYEVISEGDLGG